MLQVGYKALEHTATPKALHAEKGASLVGRLAWRVGAGAGVDLDSIGVVTQLPALHAAARAGKLVACAFLLEGKASVDLADKEGWTALHHAAEIGASNLALLLLHHGADRHRRATPRGKGKDRGTAMEIAQNHGFLQLASVVRGWAPQDDRLPFNEEVNKAAGGGKASVLASLLRGKANVEGLRKDRPDLHGGMHAIQLLLVNPSPSILTLIGGLRVPPGIQLRLV